ncbi:MULTISPECIES: ligase-associated DNA damage response endonuclease PdeM [unclassified Rhizobium]|uniref:ligase-associated DNA damage response endonuclease PdeM n=1 Tax=unclassified Rhizobium TaxID=2613769 RepID=UPI0006FA898E|nr:MULTISPECIES: ligase-associated DNA damage response endonuclease PdeM [unclassified Rhizobium]KQV44036.1 metallophosphatase [Rhizobium sp. Root1212]KRD38217.1 metallophosphatase [Rhizobium sp. Root268]
MHRLAFANRTASAAYPALSERIEINGIAGFCDPLGGLHLPDLGVLVVSDLHLEKGSAFARRGMMLPPYDTLATLRILDAIVARHDPKIVISLGDNFHDRVGSSLMPSQFRQMIEDMARGREWVWINGNHDPDGAATLPGISMDVLHLSNLVFRHEPSADNAEGEIAGHLHPAATVVRREKRVRRACFATDGTRMIMPAFGVTTGGLDLRHKALTGLFDRPRLVAHMLGRDRIYSVPFGNLVG